MNILVIPVQSVSDLITNSSSEVFILETGKTCEEVNTILNTFTSGFRYPEVFSLKDFREWRKNSAVVKLRMIGVIQRYYLQYS